MNFEKTKFAVAVSLAGCIASAQSFGGTLEDDFKSPPQKAGVHAWWHWVGYNVSKTGITRDLEAMKSAGLGGATIFTIASHSGRWNGEAMTNQFCAGMSYMNDVWWDHVKFAAEEAARLGLEVGMHNCPGYSVSGGTWIDPAHAMKKVVVSSAPVGTDRADIPQPETILGFYRDIGFAEADGRIWRIGYTCTGVRSHPVPTEIEETALECDKMSVAATKLHLKNVLEPLKAHLGAHFGTTLRHMTMDSYEAGPADWTDDMREEFARRRGYDPLPFLPALGGAKVVGAEKFRRDLADTVSELYCERHYKLFREALDDCGWRSSEHTEVRFIGSTANGVRTSIRIFLKDIEYTTRSMDVVMRAIGQRGYLADWTNENPIQEQWR